MAAAFPPPPSFYKLYGNLGIHAEKTDGEGDHAQFLPPEPPSPPEGEYQMFGQMFSTDTTLPALRDVPQLYNSETSDLKRELQTLNRQLLFYFIDLLHHLTKGPAGFQDKLKNVETALHNLQHLLNGLRPHQARAALEQTLTDQIQRKKEAIKLAKARSRLSSREG
ncbi:hypothetical protein CYMTET_20813 [Cymbomonas tetramitiformis]|uniref:Mediator of RNA polymerase II transcription subunit 7 n=1 Tax=Cymbomonas tetramitiformis TaxID=36881 RepID=A0AAE0G3E6_9CHLO|nr:hypothetical protein CYMTET_20813 [Cymbomonas tetramitiformis]